MIDVTPEPQHKLAREAASYWDEWNAIEAAQQQADADK